MVKHLMDEEGKDPVFFTDFSGKVSKREIGFFHLSRIGFASNDVPEKKGGKKKKNSGVRTLLPLLTQTQERGQLF